MHQSAVAQPAVLRSQQQLHCLQASNVDQAVVAVVAPYNTIITRALQVILVQNIPSCFA